MRAFVGVDVQGCRGCCYAVIGRHGKLLESGWFNDAVEDVSQLIERLQGKYEVFVGIDAPREPLISPRQWYWRGSRWRKRRPTEKGCGRHCEVVLQAYGLAKPQYTPVGARRAKPWMRLGFRVFSAIGKTVPTHEVFPTASYALLEGIRDVRVLMDFAACKTGPKDILDAVVAATTVREYVSGCGTEVGGGDGLGTIILPRPLHEPAKQGVLFWPQD